MLKLLTGIVAILLTLIGGMTTARLWLSFSSPLPGDHTIGDWSVLETAASDQASALERAAWARSGFAIMPRERALYFTRTTASNGRDLEGGCRYRITGTAPTAAWWSLMVYDARLSTISSDGPTSINSDNVQLDARGGYTAYLSGAREPGNWLSNRTSGTLVIVYRIYEPDETLLKDVSSVSLPVIVQSGGCA